MLPRNIFPSITLHRRKVFFLLKKKSQALMLLLGFFLPSSHNFNQFFLKK